MPSRQQGLNSPIWLIEGEGMRRNSLRGSSHGQFFKLRDNIQYGRLCGGKQSYYSYSLSAAGKGERLSCLQVKYSLFMECVNV